jgi:hypothetical protein
MPLVDLVTDLKSLKYGKDTPGGGYSGQPYIQAKIPDGLEPKSPDFILRGGYLTVEDSLTDIKRLGKMFGDLKSPNGVLFIAKQNVLSNSAARTQTSGILNEGIYTPLSTLAQAGVIAFGGHLNKQGIDPFEQTGAYAIGNGLYNSVVKSSQPLEENRLFNIYAAVSGSTVKELSGFKFNEGGVNVLSYKGGPGAPLGVGNTNIRFTNVRTGEASGINFDNYQKIQKTVDISGQQVGALQVEPFKPWTWGGPTIYTPSGSFDLINFLPSFDLNKPQSGSLSKIPNGPETWTPKQNNPDSSKYLKTVDSPDNKGVSGKYIRLTGDRLINNYNPDGKSFDTKFYNVYEPAVEGNTWPKNTDLIYANNTFTYTQEDIIQSFPDPGKLNGSPKTQDFRKVLREKLGGFKNVNGKTSSEVGATPESPDYQTKNIETRVHLENPGKRADKNYSDYTTGITYTGAVKALDKINALPIYRSSEVKLDSEDYPVNDLVKFRIAAIDGTAPNFKTFIHFRAFIDSFSDSYTADWTANKYMGRGEDFYTYNGFGRAISLSFTVAAQSKQELIPMYQKLNYLASNLAPDYSPSGYMRGPLVQLTMGGYLYEQVGFITALTYDIPNDTTWEIGINTSGGSDDNVKELPHRINVSSFSFTPIHNFVPQKQGLTFAGGEGKVTGFGQQRYIALSNGFNTNWFPKNPTF